MQQSSNDIRGQRRICFSDKQDTTFLLGGYRSEKKQLDWILGTHPKRYEKLYNVRMNEGLFSQRNGGIVSLVKPDYVLLYDYQNPSVGYHLFPCVSSSIKKEEEMALLQYPEPQGTYCVYTLGEETPSEPLDMQKLLGTAQSKHPQEAENSPLLVDGEDVVTAVDYNRPTPTLAVFPRKRVLRFIDLFAGIGGIRRGLEQAAQDKGLDTACVFTSEIKPYAVKVLHDNHPAEAIHGDITKVDTKDIPDFDVLCAGFPCQAFSAAGKRQGFADTRGTMFFEVERILRDKRPQGFILENVEGLVNHDGFAISNALCA